MDLVGMTRAHIADPHIVNKLKEGREDEIRPCVARDIVLTGFIMKVKCCVSTT